MITVRVPGTTANLGPGFDCLGLAFNVYGYFGFEELSAGLRFEGVAPAFQNADNLAVSAYRRALREMGRGLTGLKLRIQSDIPVSRGLGSSASLIVAGLTAANAAHGNPLSRARLLDLATEMEGHPDNVAPALLGGLTASMMDNGRAISMRYTLSDKLRFCALIPDFELETRLARQVLPPTVAFQDAVFNASRVAVLLRALELGDLDTVSAALQDRLHQPYRTRLIDEYDQVHDRAMVCGAAAFCISGAGPTLLCIPRTADFAQRMRAAVSDLKNNWRVMMLETDGEGARVVEEVCS